MLHVLHTPFYEDIKILIWGNISSYGLPWYIILNRIIIFSFSYCQSTPLSFSKFTRGLRSTIMFKCITCSWHKHIKFCCCLISTSRLNIIHCQSSSSQRFPNILCYRSFWESDALGMPLDVWEDFKESLLRY